MKARAAAFLLLLAFFGATDAKAQEKRKQLPMEHMSGLLELVETIPLPTD
jgi:hypothetical protein